MTSDKESSAGFSLKRWSQRKLAASRETRAEPAEPAPAAPPDTPAEHTTVQSASVPYAEAKMAALPSVDSLTADSDFTPFMRADVEPGLQHQALRKMFSDPRFNVMDGLDTYIDDYSKPDPIAPEVVARLAQARYLFDPPATRVDENGFVVDVPVPPVPVETAPAEAAPPETRSGDAAPDAANTAESASTDAVTPASGDAADNVESVPPLNPSVEPVRR